MWGAALFVTVCCTVAAASHPAARDQQTPSPVPNARARAPHKAGQGTEDGGEAHHGHHDIYAKYLALRHSPHLLELGLGCSSTAAAVRKRSAPVALSRAGHAGGRPALGRECIQKWALHLALVSASTPGSNPRGWPALQCWLRLSLVLPRRPLHSAFAASWRMLGARLANAQMKVFGLICLGTLWA